MHNELKLLSDGKFHTAPNENQAMELGVSFGAGNVDALGIARELGDGGLASCFDFGVGG